MSRRLAPGAGARTRLLVAVVALGVLLAACGGGSGGGSKARPSSTARLQIDQPTPNQVTGPDITVQLTVIGGEVVPLTQISGPLRGDQGHIHVSLDGNLVTMTDKSSSALTGLAPGSHTIQAEYVAVDHLSFRSRIIAAVIFQVKT